MPRPVVGSSGWGTTLNTDLDGIEAVALGALPKARTGGSGRYILNPGQVSSQPFTADLRTFPVNISVAQTWTEVKMNVSTAAASTTVDVALYTASGNSLIRQHALGLIDTATTGVKTVTGSWAMTVGTWWIAYAIDATGAACTASNTPASVGGPLWTPGTHANAITDTTNGGRWTNTTCPAELTGASAHTVGNDQYQMRVAITATL